MYNHETPERFSVGDTVRSTIDSVRLLGSLVLSKVDAYFADRVNGPEDV